MNVLDPSHRSWMTTEQARAVMRALKADGGDARFVGGAVRNAVLSEPVSDVDIATPLTPDEVMRRLQAAGLGAVPTGIAHGTVTAVASGKPFEVTSLRRDVTTDGRHATIAYTADWKEDATRRDFTINALYADEAGQIFDYFGGLDDLKARRVRFVGNACTRIREDYLRILRLFRFHAWYGKSDIDGGALAAATAEKAGLRTLSGERVQKELLRLLEARNPVPAVIAMAESGILAEILAGEMQLEQLARLVTVDDSNARPPDPLLRLAAMLPGGPTAARGVAASLRLSKTDRDRLVDAAATDPRIAGSLPLGEARKYLYRLGRERFRDGLLLNWASQRADPGDPDWCTLLADADTWEMPAFPLTGDDAKAAGVVEGPRIGAVLCDLEESWVEADFALGRGALLARLKGMAKG